MKDYYAILGVKSTATDIEIKSAFRRLSKLYHPDVNKNAHDKFTEINEANSVIGDKEKRKKYDDEIIAEKKRAEAQKAFSEKARQQAASAGAKGGKSSAFDIFQQRQQAQQTQIDALKAAAYTNGYNQATIDLKKIYDPQIDALSSEISNLKSTIVLYEKNLKESEQYRSKERDGLQSAFSQYVQRIKDEEALRLAAESELNKLRSEYNALKEELDLANEAIDNLLGKGDSSRHDDEDEDTELEEEDDDFDPNDLSADPEFWAEFDELEQKALDGDDSAQNSMGEFYLYGRGVELNFVTAAEWFFKSAQKGNSDGLLNYGMCLYYGEGVPKDINKAKEYILKASSAGNDFATNFSEQQGWK